MRESSISDICIAHGINEIIIGIQTQNMALIERYHMELYFESAGMILTLVSLGKYFENRSKRKTTQAITKLLDLTPKMALLLKDNSFISFSEIFFILELKYFFVNNCHLEK